MPELLCAGEGVERERSEALDMQCMQESALLRECIGHTLFTNQLTMIALKSPECQGLHWKSHKPLCRINRQTAADFKTKTGINPHGLRFDEVDGHYQQWLLVGKLFFSNPESVLIMLPDA